MRGWWPGAGGSEAGALVVLRWQRNIRDGGGGDSEGRSSREDVGLRRKEKGVLPKNIDTIIVLSMKKSLTSHVIFFNTPR